MWEIPDSRLPWTDRCLFCSRCLDRGRRNRFPPFCLDGFLKHAAFEEGIANQKRLKAPLKQFQRISSLDNNSAVFTAMPKYRTSVTSNISTPSLFTMHTCQQTVTVKCFQLRLDLLLPLKKKTKTKKPQITTEDDTDICCLTWADESGRPKLSGFILSARNRKTGKTKSGDDMKPRRCVVRVRSAIFVHADTSERPSGTDSCPSLPPLKVWESSERHSKGHDVVSGEEIQTQKSVFHPVWSSNSGRVRHTSTKLIL